MMQRYKKIVFLIFLLAAGAAAGSFFAQYVLGLNPCPLCIFQRIGVLAVLAVALVLLCVPMKNTAVQWLSAVLLTLPAAAGLAVAVRQLHLQSLPPEKVPACGPGLDFMMQTMPLGGVIGKVLSGSGECAKVEKVFFLPLPLWSLLFFAAVLLAAWGGLWWARRQSFRQP